MLSVNTFIQQYFFLQMLTVRQTLTEILLEVTNEEIKSIASDTLSKKRSKGNTDQIFTKICFYVMRNRRFSTLLNTENWSQFFGVIYTLGFYYNFWKYFLFFCTKFIARKAQPVRKTALSSLTGGLGKYTANMCISL